MLNLFPELASIGSGVGSAVGGLLGQVGDVLSTPRRALWDLLGADGRSGAELVGGLTGDPESALSKILGFGLEVAGDPLTLAGFGLGRAGGAAAGKGLSRAAEAAGPGYAADAAKLSQGWQQLPGGMNNSTLGHLLEQDAGALGRVASELPEGSKILGGGGEGIAYLTPQGNVVRVGAGVGPVAKGGFPLAPEARAVAPEILQPARNVTTANLRAEHLPRVGTMDDDYARVLGQFGVQDLNRMSRPPAGLDEALGGMEGTWAAADKGLKQSALARGLDLMDSNSLQNVARTAEGKWLTHDPGVFEWVRPGGPVAPSVALEPNQSGLAAWLAQKLGGQGRLRSALETPFSTAGQGVSL